MAKKDVTKPISLDPRGGRPRRNVSRVSKALIES